MAENSQESRREAGREHGSEAEVSSESASATSNGMDGYAGHVRHVLSSPDAFFASGYRSDRGHALIDLGVYGVAVFLAALIARITGYSGWDFEFGHLVDALKSVLTIGIALAVAVGGLVVYGGRGGKSQSTGFYLEKLGAALLVPAVLLLAAIVFDVLDIRIHAWLRGLSVAFVYVLVFGFAYRYAAPGRLTVAAGFLAGFYLLYRLLALLF